MFFIFFEFILSLSVFKGWETSKTMPIFIGLFIVFLVLQYFRSTEVTIDGDVMRVRHFLGLRYQQINLKRLSSVEVVRYYGNYGATFEQYHRLRLRDKDGNQAKFGISFIVPTWKNQFQLLSTINAFVESSGATYNQRATDKLRLFGVVESSGVASSPPQTFKETLHKEPLYKYWLITAITVIAMYAFAVATGIID